MNDIERHNALLKAIDNKSIENIEKALGKKGTADFQENLVKGLKASYTNVNSILHREDSNNSQNLLEIKQNKLLFKNLLKIAEKHSLDLSSSINGLIDRLQRDLKAFQKSGKKMENTDHPLYKMANSLIEYDIRAEARLVMKPAVHLIKSENTEPTSVPRTKSNSTEKSR